MSELNAAPFSKPIHLLNMVDGLELVTLDRPDECCGFGGTFCVAENGAVWLPEQRMGQRIIPYICQHLAVVVPAERIVPTLHEAYAQIGAGDYGFGAFIGGPSKTADIEQALVLGAHGPISMTVFILEQPIPASASI